MAAVIVVVGERKLECEVIPYRKVKSGAGGRLTKVVSQSKKRRRRLWIREG